VGAAQQACRPIPFQQQGGRREQHNRDSNRQRTPLHPRRDDERQGKRGYLNTRRAPAEAEAEEEGKTKTRTKGDVRAGLRKKGTNRATATSQRESRRRRKKERERKGSRTRRGSRTQRRPHREKRPYEPRNTETGEQECVARDHRTISTAREEPDGRWTERDTTKGSDSEDSEAKRGTDGKSGDGETQRGRHREGEEKRQRGGRTMNDA